MARLVKNIDTRQYGSLKAGRLLDGVLPESKIAELIASGHAKATDGDNPSLIPEKTLRTPLKRLKWHSSGVIGMVMLLR
ncbi:hypothetical protein ATS59_03630 [Salmonella enterica subsp. enterica serovar Litchfield]|nr:hypothetical protein [Salmonella enterica subsp. enterica serovar Litchfield]